MNKKFKYSNSAFFFIGYSSAGKTTLAKLFQSYLDVKGFKTFLFDGNEMANLHILQKFDGFDIDSRNKRALQLTSLVNWIKLQGIIPIVAVIGQPKEARDNWRENINGYKEIFLKCDLETCKKRDNKDLYNNSLAKNKIVGEDVQFDEPKHSDLILDAKNNNPDQLLKLLLNNNII